VETWLQVVAASVASVVASSGFWAFMQRKGDSKSATTRLLMGLAYDKITTSGVEHIERGWVTRDELEELHNYYYGPYKDLGGNGVAERIMTEVRGLPIRSHSKYASIFQHQNEGFVNNVRVITPNEAQDTPAG
jgi:hypothetical protein